MGFNSGFKGLRLVSYCSGVWRAVAQLIEALRHKQGSRGFNSRCCYWIFSSTSSPLKTGTIFCPETSVQNSRCTLCNIKEHKGSHENYVDIVDPRIHRMDTVS